MENRIDELASIVEWVDDMALEPKWRLELAALHPRPMAGARSSEPETSTPFATACGTAWCAAFARMCSTSFRPRTDTRVPIEMTEAQMTAHDDLNQPIAQLVQRSLKRPLTQAEFLRLMSLLTTQRIISNGMAQLQFERPLADDPEPPSRGERCFRGSPHPS